jgi:hypothetical protein
MLQRTFFIEELAAVGTVKIADRLKVDVPELQNARYQLEDLRHLGLVKPNNTHRVLQSKATLRKLFKVPEAHNCRKIIQGSQLKK